jgi:hypothetical protein
MAALMPGMIALPRPTWQCDPNAKMKNEPARQSTGQQKRNEGGDQ